MNVLEKELAEKGYVTIVSVSKRDLKPKKADFSNILDEIKKAVEQSKAALSG